MEASVERHWFLNKVNFLKGTALEERKSLIQQSILHRYPSQSTIFSPGQEGTYVYILQKGRVTMFDLTSNGRMTIYWIAYPGEIFGLADFYGDATRSCFAKADIESHILKIPKSLRQ